MGTLPHCENGATLRLYLARKLHCTPMRISKKFAGANVGKAIYLAKQSQSLPGMPMQHMPGVPVTPASAAREPKGSMALNNLDELPLHVLEASFYQSLDNMADTGSSVCSSMAPTPPTGSSLGPTPPPPPSFAASTGIPQMHPQAVVSQQQIPFQPGLLPHVQIQAQAQNFPTVPNPVSRLILKRATANTPLLLLLPCIQLHNLESDLMPSLCCPFHRNCSLSCLRFKPANSFLLK